MKAKPYVGAHVSIRGGYGQAARFARESGATCFQYFPKNPRSLKPKMLETRDAHACAEYCREHGIASFAHTPYPTNLAAPAAGPSPRSLMVASLRNDLDIAEACGSLGIIVHFGQFSGLEPLQGYQNIIQCLNEVLVDWQGKARVLIENQAGNHGREGMTLEELVKIRELSLYPDKVGFCLDTCHAFAAGIWDPRRTEDLLERGAKLNYWPHLGAVHLNDSLYDYGSRRDRHAPLGRGKIGIEGLKSLITAPPMQGTAIAMETEKGPDGTHRHEINVVNQWF